MRFLRGTFADERGASLPLIAGLLVLLMGTSALAVDLGWLYVNSSRLQKAADSAALAGVVHVPGFMTKAQTDAETAARFNGYTIGGTNTMALNVIDDTNLQVDLASKVDTFFLRALGFGQFDITRRSTAEYIKPVPLGSPDQCFGEDPTNTYCANDPNFWAAISGPWANTYNGDPYSTRCKVTQSSPGQVTSTSCASGPNANHEYRTGGYWYTISVPEGSTDLRIRIYDAAFYERGNIFLETGDGVLSADLNIAGATTHFEVHYPDSTSYDTSDNVAVAGCRWDLVAETPGYKNQWTELCHQPTPTAGDYLLHVWTSGGSGSNQYSVAATASHPSGERPRVAGVNDISIYTNQGGTTADLMLAEILPVHAGKTLELRFYDAGEDDNDANMKVIRPDPSNPGGVVADCVWTSTRPGYNGSGPCDIQTAEGSNPPSQKALFNGHWITAEVEIPADYTCDSTAPRGCWWKMEITNSQPHDRTTWTARVIGNPVRLVRNQP